MSYRWIASMLALTIAGGCIAEHCAAKPTGKPAKKAPHKPAAKKEAPVVSGDASTWIADPKLVVQLDQATNFGSYSLRLPVGYTIEEHDMSTDRAAITGYLAKGAPRKDNTFAVIFVVVSEAKPGFAPTDLETILNGNPFLNGKAGIVKTDAESGTIGPLSAMRQYYKYPAQEGSTHFLHGFHYASVSGQSTIIVAAMDAGPHHAKSLPLAEAAALTLHKSE
ncbi:MAG: hypothetical protein ABIY70_28270 [Capsulimonas sp.]|uniref:hypothetical protein n=1 Tax=Capsulimonas sp. TaxID=2494211 RepID=UPI0032633CE6